MSTVNIEPVYWTVEREKRERHFVRVCAFIEDKTYAQVTEERTTKNPKDTKERKFERVFA